MEITDAMVEAAALSLLPQITSWDHLRAADKATSLERFKPRARAALEAALAVAGTDEPGKDHIGALLAPVPNDGVTTTCPACKRAGLKLVATGNDTEKMVARHKTIGGWCLGGGTIIHVGAKADDEDDPWAAYSDGGAQEIVTMRVKGELL